MGDSHNNGNSSTALQPVFKRTVPVNAARFAPSPTGSLHIGGLRSALFSWAHAQKIKGRFILRIEDTDRKRFVPGSMYEILQVLHEFGLSPDQYPSVDQIQKSINNDFGWYTHDWAQHLDKLEGIKSQDFDNVFIQSLRLALYQKAAIELVRRGFAYFCFCSPQRLEKVNKQRRSKGLQPGYDKHCKVTHDLSDAFELIKKGHRPVVRMDFDAFAKHLGTNKLVYTDALLGKIEFDLSLQNHGVLLKSDGFPTYHLAVVVDDYLMGVHTTIRGYEWVSSIPKHVLVATGLGLDLPQTVHLPVILDPKGGKLSKRHGAVSVFGILQQGYLHEAILNFLMYLGFNPIQDGQDPKITLQEFVQNFDILKVSKSNPVFDRTKLVYFNKRYLTDINLYEFNRRFVEYVTRFKYDIIESALNTCDLTDTACPIPEKCLNSDSLSSIVDKIVKDFTNSLPAKLDMLKVRTDDMLTIFKMLVPFYTKTLKITDFGQIKGVKRYDASTIHKALAEFKNYIKEHDMFKNNQEFVAFVRDLADRYNIKHADMFMAIRLATYGSNISPPLFDYLRILCNNYDKNIVIDKIDQYLKWVSQL